MNFTFRNLNQSQLLNFRYVISLAGYLIRTGRCGGWENSLLIMILKLLSHHPGVYSVSSFIYRICFGPFRRLEAKHAGARGRGWPSPGASRAGWPLGLARGSADAGAIFPLHSQFEPFRTFDYDKSLLGPWRHRVPSRWVSSVDTCQISFIYLYFYLFCSWFLNSAPFTDAKRKLGRSEGSSRTFIVFRLTITLTSASPTVIYYSEPVSF